MNKERLEEIKEHFAHCMDEGLLFAEQEEKLLEELYEQAERNLTAQETVEILGESLKQSIEQNKRYREAIEYVMNAKVNQYASVENVISDIKFVLSETLEGESNE